MARDFWAIWRKICTQIACKAVRRALCGIALGRVTRMPAFLIKKCIRLQLLWATCKYHRNCTISVVFILPYYWNKIKGSTERLHTSLSGDSAVQTFPAVCFACAPVNYFWTDTGMSGSPCIMKKETLHKARRTALHAICRKIWRRILCTSFIQCFLKTAPQKTIEKFRKQVYLLTISWKITWQ